MKLIIKFFPYKGQQYIEPIIFKTNNNQTIYGIKNILIHFLKNKYDFTIDCNSISVFKKKEEEIITMENTTFISDANLEKENKMRVLYFSIEKKTKNNKNNNFSNMKIFRYRNCL